MNGLRDDRHNLYFESPCTGIERLITLTSTEKIINYNLSDIIIFVYFAYNVSSQ